MSTPKTKRIEVEDRRVKVATLMRAGTNQRDMARALNVSLGTINRDVAAVLSEWRANILNDIEAAKAVDLDRIETLIRNNWPKALSGNYAAQDRVFRAIEMRRDIYGYKPKDESVATSPAPLTIIEVVRPAGTQMLVTSPSSSDQPDQ